MQYEVGNTQYLTCSYNCDSIIGFLFSPFLCGGNGWGDLSITAADIKPLEIVQEPADELEQHHHPQATKGEGHAQVLLVDIQWVGGGGAASVYTHLEKKRAEIMDNL